MKCFVNHRECLDTFLDDAGFPIRNNDSEQDIRHIAGGGKSWLVLGSAKGCEVACQLYLLRLSCRQNDVDPEADLADVLMTVGTMQSSKIASLTPWAWSTARKSGRGD